MHVIFFAFRSEEGWNSGALGERATIPEAIERTGGRS
jgi:hypothetical protein